MDKSMREKKQLNIEYALDDALDILRQGQNRLLLEPRKVRPAFLDTFLFSGRFNSVLGLDGFQFFKDELKELVKRVNADDFGQNYINLDTMYQTLLKSGVYYEDKYLPDELTQLQTNTRWLTAYRYIAKNFPEINYKDFREIVKRFRDSDGHSFFISKEDSPGLRAIMQHHQLFKETIDGKASLLQLTQSQLRAICEKTGAKPARSTEDTADRILSIVGSKILDYLPNEAKSLQTFFIKDEDLATGQDIISLDIYLRAISKVVRSDLSDFINKQRLNLISA
jgi:hypothetical protein